MFEREVPTRRVIRLAVALSGLARQLDPGILAYRVGQLLDVVSGPADELQKKNQRLLENFAEKDGKDFKMEDIPNSNGQKRYVFSDMAAYEAEEEALNGGVTRMRFPIVLTEEHIKAISTSLIKPTPGPAGQFGPGTPASREPVDFAALIAVMETEEEKQARNQPTG
jgi:hypothetical protein